MTDFWDDPFHTAALQAGIIAFCEGRLDDSEYVKQLAYEIFNEDSMPIRLTPTPTSASIIGESEVL